MNKLTSGIYRSCRFLCITLILIICFIALPVNTTLAATGGIVVIDPGHSAGSPGMTAVDGSAEVEWNARITYQAAVQLKEKGLTVYTTHCIDQWVPNASLEIPYLIPEVKGVYDFQMERAACASAVNADLYVSIHHNSHNGIASGSECFWMSTPD